MGVEWLNRYVALEKEDSYGVEPGAVSKIVLSSGGTGWSSSATGTWTMTSAEGGKGASGTLTTVGGTATTITSFTVLEGGQGFSHNDTFSIVISGLGSGVAPAMTVSIGGQPESTDGATNGTHNTNGLIYGEVDDESMKQTFELLTRSDMSRQVASKAVTNTQYGEGSINLAIQPDDFMGNILYAFLPVEEIGTGVLESVAINNAGSGGTAGNYIIEVTSNSATENAEVGMTVDGSGNMSAVNIINPGRGLSSSGLAAVSMTKDKDGRATGLSSASLTLAVGTDAYKHYFNEPTLSTHAYPSYTMRVGREGKEHTFTGMVATKLGISANLNEYVMASVDWVGKNEESPTTLQTNVPFAGLNTDALHFADAEVYFSDNASKTIKVQQISFEININRDNDSAYAVGSRSFTRAPPTQTREITGTLEFNEVIHTTTTAEPTYSELTGQSVHILQPDLGKGAIRVRFKNEAGTEFLEFEFYNVRFEAPEASVSGRDPNRMSVGFQAFYDAKQGGAQKSVQAILKGVAGGAIQNTRYSA